MNVFFAIEYDLGQEREAKPLIYYTELDPSLTTKTQSKKFINRRTTKIQITHIQYASC